MLACIHNAGRSQMAAAFFNQPGDPQKAQAVSAGTRVHAKVLTVTQEIGVNQEREAPEAHGRIDEEKKGQHTYCSNLWEMGVLSLFHGPQAIRDDA